MWAIYDDARNIVMDGFSTKARAERELAELLQSDDGYDYTPCVVEEMTQEEIDYRD